ncbi:39465_t:CDS:2 [Gigaspora margarita]|uniref:39465_t:CDS:1 n=1 Tax=Gigaspora margarita TaxID=4874 RepID=A0ABN7VCA8_GIGMA|nr:39465_t:CDS:2 [Gigaspora margarita]
MTVSNGWSFRRVENPDSLAIFKFLNLKIALSAHKKLSRKVLDKAITEFMSKIEETAQKDLVGITVTLDAQDISSERVHAQDVIFKIEEAQKLNKLKELYESTSTTFLLNPSKNVPSTLTSSISDDDSDENNLLDLESNNIYELQEHPVD